MSIVGRIVDTAPVDTASLDAGESEKQPEPRISTKILVPPVLTDFPADVYCSCPPSPIWPTAFTTSNDYA